MRYHEFFAFVDSATTLTWMRAIAIVVIGFLIAQLCAHLVGRVARHRLDRHRGVLVRRLVFYSLFALVLLFGLRQVNHDIGNIFLGAAGILTVAVGFASQTSASNLISGLFLIGDTVNVGDTTDEVLSIDWLSVRLRTFDNLLVRLLNETLVKSQIIHLSRFPIRRIDLKISVGEKEDLPEVWALLMGVSDSNSDVLIEPRPKVRFSEFGDSSFNLLFCVWTRRESYVTTRTVLAEGVIQAFRQHDIELPYPYRALTTGSLSQPFPVSIVTGPGEQGSQDRR